MTYDPEERRDTPLALKLKERIRRHGPIQVAEYMEACLQDPEHGYYRTQRAIGAAGDFITAPEISQVFGELIGLWCAVVWQEMGSPERINLVELGPGRGTLMRDGLRAARTVPAFQRSLSVHLVESNEALRALQAKALEGCGVQVEWHEDLGEPLTGSRIYIANEFLDTMPVTQFAHERGAWHRRTVEIGSDGQLCFGIGAPVGDHLSDLPPPERCKDGAVLERCGGYLAMADELSRAAGSGATAALFLDYGHAESGFGETLQAVAQHEHVSPFIAPGETDLTAHVDFQWFGQACGRTGGHLLAVDGPIPQAVFLGRLGIVERASRLMAANPAKAGEIEAGALRLIAPTGMGTRFKAIGVRSAGLPPLPGF